MSNPFLTPESKVASIYRSEEPAFIPTKNSWLKFLAIVLLGVSLSSLIVWWNVYSAGASYGGTAVELSDFGHCFFLSAGAVVGLVGSLVAGAIFCFACSNSSKRNVDRSFIVSLAISAIISPMFAFVVFMVLSMTVFFAIPDEWFRVLFYVLEQ